jgi:hypothetical protein
METREQVSVDTNGDTPVPLNCKCAAYNALNTTHPSSFSKHELCTIGTHVTTCLAQRCARDIWVKIWEENNTNHDAIIR